MRSAAATALGLTGDARAVDPLIAALSDPEPSVVWEAARALGLIRDGAATGPLFACLTHAKQEVRCDAATALGRIGDPSALDHRHDKDRRRVRLDSGELKLFAY